MGAKTKTSELIGLALDWAVATCEGGKIRTENGVFLNQGDGYDYFTPSTNWAQGGPIIEREGIDLYCNVPSSIAEKHNGWEVSWWARYCRCGVGTDGVHGTAPLVAAMRCYVASKLGDEIDIPKELLP